MSSILYTSIEELFGLPEEEAVQSHFDAKNFKWFRNFAIAFSLLALVATLAALVESDYPRMILPAANLVLIRWLFTVREKETFRRHFRHILALYLLIQFVIVGFLHPQQDITLRLLGFLAPLLLLFFRFRLAESVFLFTAVWVGTLSTHVWELLSQQGSPLLSPRFVFQTAVTAACLYFAVTTTRRERRQFLRTFQIEQSRSRERARMRKELDSARQIQLSMLPRSDPKIDGLDISAVSLPATEVGGDYYEYFQRSDGGVAIVAGDVAGHGVASGLLLSGIRSCLYLLHHERPSPQEILEKLNRMVRQTTDRRMFITLLYAVVDPRGRTLTLSSAGHPPVLHYSRASESVQELRQSAPPLGTRLDAVYSEKTVGFESGDVFVLSTDGLEETMNQRGEHYGEKRFLKKISNAAPTKSAREIREAVLSDLWNFKGDAEQFDDITMVVVKIR